MKYTGSKKADEKVEKDLKKVVKLIVDELNPISIILFGGFGRGEGTYEIREGKVVPLNDYDLYVVTKKKIPDERLEEIGKRCSNLLGKGGGEFVENYNEIYEKNKYFHVDLRWLGYNQLGKLKRINRTYELKHGSAIIYGEDVRDKIPEIKVPLSEAFRYLTNPAGHLILCMDGRRLRNEFKKDEKFYLLHHIVKTYLAFASSLIISEGEFEPNYTDTVKRCKKIYGEKFPELIKKIVWALDLKLSPKNRKVEDIRKKWFEARDDLYFVLGYLAKKHLGVEAENVADLTKKIYKKLPYVYFTSYIPLPKFLAKKAFFSQYALNVFYSARTKQFKSLLYWKDVGLRIFLASFLVLYSIDDEKMREKAYKQIKIFAPVKSKNWKDLREGLLYGFDKYYSQKII